MHFNDVYIWDVILFSVREYTDVNNLLNSSTIFKEQKKKWYSWKLNKHGTNRYLQDDTFLRNKMSNPRVQLSLEFYEIFDFNKIQTESFCQKIQNTFSVHLEIYHRYPEYEKKTIRDISLLHGINTVTIKECIHLYDVYPLRDARIVKIEHCSLHDITPLKNLFYIELFRCKNIVDVSSLANIHTVKIGNCINVKNISSLRHVHTLAISFCPIEIYFNTCAIHSLTIDRCPIPQDMKCFDNIYSLTIQCISGVIKNSVLFNIDHSYQAHRFDMSQITNISHLYMDTRHGSFDVIWPKSMINMHSVCIPQSKFINTSDISIFSRVHTLDLSNSLFLEDVSALGNIHTLKLSNCRLLKYVYDLGNVYDLNLEYCPLLKNVHGLGNNHKLSVAYCRSLKDVSNLGNVYDLNVSSTQIKDVSALGNVHTLHLNSCNHIVDVSALHSVHTLYITECLYIKDISALENVHTLHYSPSIGGSQPLPSKKKIQQKQYHGKGKVLTKRIINKHKIKDKMKKRKREQKQREIDDEKYAWEYDSFET